MTKNTSEYKEPLNVKIIEDILTELSASKKKTNSFLVTGGCIEKGLIQIDVVRGDMCSNEKCGLCSGFRKAFNNLI